MIALRYARFGEPAEVVEATDIPVPEPREGETVLNMVRSPIHNHDLATIRGVYGVRPKLPATGGSECVGTIAGKRYACMAAGAWAGQVIAAQAALVPVPDEIDDDRACQLLAMPLSTVVLFDELRTKPGMWIAQTAAGGAVGKTLLQLAREHGVNIVNFVRREEAAEDLRRHYGAQHVVVTALDDWQQRARALTGGEGFARIVDSVAGPQSLELQQLLAPLGELIVFGALSGAALKLDPGLMIARETIVRGFWMNTWMQRASEADRVDAMQRVFALARSGALALPVAGIYPLRDAAQALRAAETPGRSGKILFAP